MNLKIIWFSILIGLVSCKKDKGLIDFTMKMDTAGYVSAGIPVSLPFEIMTPPVSTNSQAELQGRGSELRLINFVKLDQLRLNITSPSGKTFSFLKDISVYIKADGLDEIMIAGKTNVPANVGSELYLDCTGENLKEYIKKSEYSIRVNIVTDETVTQKIDYNIHTEFKVNAGLSK